MTIRDQSLIERLDFFWDPIEERLRFEIPALPEAWTDQEELPGNTMTELRELGRMVIEMLDDAYVDWGTEEVSDETWTEETFSDEE